MARLKINFQKLLFRRHILAEKNVSSDSAQVKYFGQTTDSGKRFGYGTEMFSNGRIAFAGFWKQDLRHGEGTEFYPSGSVKVIFLKMCFDRSNFHHIIRARWYQVLYLQCDQFRQNFATLAKFKPSWQNLSGFIQYWGKFCSYFCKNVMLLGNFAQLQIAKYF